MLSEVNKLHNVFKLGSKRVFSFYIMATAILEHFILTIVMMSHKDTLLINIIIYWLIFSIRIYFVYGGITM